MLLYKRGKTFDQYYTNMMLLYLQRPQENTIDYAIHYVWF